MKWAKTLFPLNCGRWLRRYVVAHAVGSRNFSNDTAGNLSQHIVGELCPVSGHCIARLNSAQDDGALIRALVTHNANALDVGQNREVLPTAMLAVAFARFLEQTLVVCVQFFANNGIGILENLKLFGAYCANDANSQTGAREGLAVNDVCGQAKGSAQCANLVLEEVVKRLNKVEVNTFREGDEVVVAFDGGSLSAGFASTRFNDV